MNKTIAIDAPASQPIAPAINPNKALWEKGAEVYSKA
jgi:hypothetical protein